MLLGKKEVTEDTMTELPRREFLLCGMLMAAASVSSAAQTPGASPPASGNSAPAKEPMRARYTRLFTDERGVSRFADGDIQLNAGLPAPPAEPVPVAPF